ncbi:MAG: hypothetical protein GX868_17555 [Actinobacteria bacterium]|nr:hypothetical protein [Actinomycetota bacterium]
MASIDVFCDEVAHRGAARLDRLVFALGGVFDSLVDVDTEVDRLDRLADRFTGNSAMDLLVWMSRSGFRGNSADYYNPDNSMLHRVVRTGFGIPITLSVLAIEIGRRHDIELVGIGAPGEFLFRSVDDDSSLYNPFRGKVVDQVEILALLDARPLPSGVRASDLLCPVGPLQIVERMLNNLEQIFQGRRSLVGLERVLRLRTALPSSSTAARRRYAAVLEECGDIGRGLEQIRRVIDSRDPADDVLAVRKDWLLRRRLEAHLN